MVHFYTKRWSKASLILGHTFFVILVSLGCSSVKQPPANVSPDTETSAVAVIAGIPITLSEFVREYERTAVLDSDPKSDSLAAYLDFLERYVDFKLKVLEAKEAGYHEFGDLIDEIGGYRNQLARPYLLQEEVTDPLIQLIHARRQEMVEASHILIQLGASAAPEDTLAAYERLLAIRDSVGVGFDFGELAFRHSDDASARGNEGSPGYQGRLGTFGGGKMVDEFEDMAFSTSIDSVSDIFRTQFGYHILKVHSRAPLPGDILLAHIMIQASAGTAADSAAALETLSEIQKKIAEGEDFADLAAEYSADRGSASRGGELQRMAFDGGLPATMRDEAFSMEVGDISDVIESPFGFHLIRVLERFPIETLEEAQERLSGNLAQLPRARKAEEAFARQKRSDLGAKVDSLLVESWFDQLGADSLLKGLSSVEFSAVDPIMAIAWMGDSTYTVGQLIDHIRLNRLTDAATASESFWRTMDDFLDDQALDYEIAALEERNPAFARTMNEFRDGLILFRLMEDSIWTAASIDSTGLESFYGPRSNTYRFEDRSRIITISHPADSLLLGMVADLRSGTSLGALYETILVDSLSLIRVDTTMIEGSSNSVFDKALNLNPGEITDPQSYNNGYLILYNDGIDPAREKTFAEARAQAVNDYQLVLEERLIARLRRKYDVVLFPERLQYLLKPKGIEQQPDSG